MTRRKIVYIGAGSTRGPGTNASFIRHAADYAGCEIVLVDINREHLLLNKRLARKMAKESGADIVFTATTDRRAALKGASAVLTSFRPGGFEARYLDESIPLKHDVIGQETQGPGGFFMALRSINVVREIVADMEELCPNAILINYTNPINIVSQAVTTNSKIKTISLCEGPIEFPRWFASRIGLDPNKLDTVMVGLNHGSWSVRHLYDGQDFMPLLAEGYERLKREGVNDTAGMRLIRLALRMQSLPAHYFQYFYFKDEILAELKAKPTTRSQDILAEVPAYYAHYREQANKRGISILEPRLSRGGLLELELAVAVLASVLNDRREIWPVNVPNNGAISDFADDLVVEVPAYVDKNGATPLVSGKMPGPVVGLVHMLAQYQRLTADAAWSGNRSDAIQALASHPLVFSLEKAEAIYDEMSTALQSLLPARLLQD